MRYYWGIIYGPIVCLFVGLKDIRMNPLYYIVAKYEDGGIATVLNKRSYWKIKTARKHLRSLVLKQIKGEYKNVKYFALMMV